ncbi:hypothetical protein K2X33_00475 [bacterium]|nr:hypothetical protein [bacterium]
MRILGMAAGLALFFLGGCAHQRVLEKPLKPLVWADFWKDQTVRRGTLGEFSGKLKLGYEGKGQSISGRGRIVGKEAKNFRLELRDPIGRLHYVLVDKAGEVSVHYPRERFGYKDATGGRAYFQKTLGRRVAFAELVSLFLGVLPSQWEKARASGWEWDRDHGAFRGSLELGGENLTVWVDSGHAGLREFDWLRDGHTVHATLADFSDCCDTQGQRRAGFQLAYEVKIDLGEGASTSASWDSLARPSSPLPAAAFELPFPAGDKVSVLGN